METETTAPGDGQGEATGTPTDGGQGEEYGGFETAPELVADHQARVEEITSLQDQVANLESLKGRQGNEMGQLKHQIASLGGQIEGMRSAAPQSAVPTVDDVIRKFNDGEITEADAFRQVSDLSAKTTEANLKGHVAEQIGQFKAETESARYTEKFIADNPGYKEAFETGQLDQWLTKNPDGSVNGGEAAWAQHQLQTKTAEIETLKQQAEAATKVAEQNGVDKGIKIEKGKSSAGQVLSGSGGQFSATSGAFDLSNPAQRRLAGIEKLKALRG